MIGPGDCMSACVYGDMLDNDLSRLQNFIYLRSVASLEQNVLGCVGVVFD